MKKILSLLVLMFVLFSFTLKIDTVESDSNQSACQDYAVGQILAEIQAFGPMSNSEVTEAYDFYMDICESDGTAIPAVIIG